MTSRWAVTGLNGPQNIETRVGASVAFVDCLGCNRAEWRLVVKMLT